MALGTSLIYNSPCMTRKAVRPHLAIPPSRNPSPQRHKSDSSTLQSFPSLPSRGGKPRTVNTGPAGHTHPHVELNPDRPPTSQHAGHRGSTSASCVSAVQCGMCASLSSPLPPAAPLLYSSHGCRVVPCKAKGWIGGCGTTRCPLPLVGCQSRPFATL